MTKSYLFSESLRRFAAYVCLGAGVLSVSQMPIATIAQVYAAEEVVAEEAVPTTDESVEVEVALDVDIDAEITEVADEAEEDNSAADSQDEVVAEEGVEEGDNLKTNNDSGSDDVLTTNESVENAQVSNLVATTPVISDVAGDEEVDGVAAGLTGSVVILTGTGFTETGNAVDFGGTVISDLPAENSNTTITFTVPNDALEGIVYDISVTNDQNLTSDLVSFLVTSVQPTTVQARIVITDIDNQDGGNVDDVLFLGSNSNIVAEGEWFTVYENGQYFNDPATSGYEDVEGLAVRRDGDKVGVVLHGSFPTSGWREYVRGYVEFDGATVACQNADQSNGNPLENGFDGVYSITPGNDEVWVTGEPTNKSHFNLTVDTGDDGFYTQFDITSLGNLCDEVSVINPSEEETPTITSFNPSSAATNTSVTIIGTGFTETGNIIDFGGITISDRPSANNGTTITFTVPAEATLGVKFVTVENNNGVSDEANFEVIRVNPVSRPTITSFNPASAATSTVVTIIGTGFTTLTPNTIDFGGITISDRISVDGTTINFTVPAEATLGTKFVTVENANGVSDEANFEVISQNPVSRPTITSFNPSSAATNTEVTIIGTGFTEIGNIIDFGGITISDRPSANNGTTITFTVPAEATLGVKFVTVENTNGVSDEANFEVVAGNDGNGTCSDGIQNGDETGVDVGGRCDDDNDDDGGGRRGGGGNGRHRHGTTTPVVVPTVVATTTLDCAPYLTEYIKFGADNNSAQVVKLQSFLNEHEGERLAVTGIYDIESFEAVKRFQTKYSSDVLNPWGDNQESTGYVFITTQLKINLLACNSNEKINLDLRNYYPNPGAPGQEIGLLPIIDLDDDNFAQATVTPATSTDIAEATSTGYFQLAAAGILDFLSIYPWWWWLLVIVLIVVISWLLKKSDDDDDDQDGEEVVPQTGYLPLV